MLSGAMFGRSKPPQEDQARDWAQVTVEGIHDEEYGFFQTYFVLCECRAELGEAIAAACDAAELDGGKNVYASEVELYFGDVDLTEAVECGEDCWTTGSRSLFPIEDSFVPPVGIVAAPDERTSIDVDDIFPSFERFQEGALFGVVAVPGRHELMPAFSALVECVPDVRALLVGISQQWHDPDVPDDAPLKNLAGENFRTPADVLEFLAKYTKSIVENGYILTTARAFTGDTSISIDTHKTLYAWTEDGSVHDRICQSLSAAGLEESEDALSLQWNVGHHHYAPPGSLSETALVEQLLAEGFQHWSPDD